MVAIKGSTPLIGPRIARLCSARCRIRRSQIHNSSPRDPLRGHRKERARSCLEQEKSPRTKPDQLEERPRPPVGQARTRTKTSPPSSATTTPICSARSAQRGASERRLALPHADTDMMQLHLAEILELLSPRMPTPGASQQGQVAHPPSKLDMPENIPHRSPLPASRAPELNPVESVAPGISVRTGSQTPSLKIPATPTRQALLPATHGWKLTAQPETITSIGMRDWAHVRSLKSL